ncbi:MAG TPA: hypothetical protein PLV58_12675 [Campylobacterales bacterium]|nr:hypothetical protein [Campylobacterales bacterium]
MFLSILSNNEREDFLNLAINMAHIDGDFANAEKVQINAYALEMGLMLKDKSAYSKTNDELITELSKSNIATKKAIFAEIIALALVDGIHSTEEELLNTMQIKFDLDNKFKQDLTDWYGQILPLYRRGYELVGIGGVI